MVLDAPATGNALGMLGSPQTFGAIARVGPIAGQTERVQELLRAPERTGYLAVAMAISALLSTLGKMPADERKKIGAAANALKDEVTEALAARRALLKQQALDANIPSPAPRATALQAFSLGDPASGRRVLYEAGFADVTFAEVHEPVYYGADIDAALAFVLQFSTVQEMVGSLPDTARNHAIGRLRDLMVAHHCHDGVWLDARAWIVAARRI